MSKFYDCVHGNMIKEGVLECDKCACTRKGEIMVGER